MKVAVFGLGYVGTVTAACLAARGHDIWGVDIDEHKVAMVGDGRTPVLEPGLGELIADAVASGALHATTSVAEALTGAEVSIVCVGTPSSANGGTDLSFVTRATEEIAQVLAAAPEGSPFHAVVVRSTVPPGTVDEIVAPVLRATGARVGTAMCPEFLREGSGVADFFDPPFTVVGTGDPDVAEAMLVAVRVPRPTCAGRGRSDSGVAQVRLQRLSRREGRLRERARSRLFRPLGIDSRAGDGAVLRGPSPQHLAELPATRLCVRRAMPAEGPAVASALRRG